MEQSHSVSKAVWLIIETGCINFISYLERFHPRSCFEWGHTGATAHARGVPEAGLRSVLVPITFSSCHEAGESS